MAKPVRLTQEMIDEYKAAGFWDDQSITDILNRNAENYPDKEAVVDSRRRLTWSELNRMVNAVAIGLLRRGMKRDQAMVIQLPNSVTSLTLLLACQKAGILCCFAPMTFRHNELRHVLKTLNASAVATTSVYRDTDYFSMAKAIARGLTQLNLLVVTGQEIPHGALSFEDLAETALPNGRDPEDALDAYSFNPFEVLYVLLSSGTTGMPKCIEHTGSSLKAAGWGVCQRARLAPDDVFGNIAPLSGGPGLQNWWACFQLGAKFCLQERFTPEGALRLIEQEKVSYLPAIPTQLVRILKETDLQKYDLSSLRVVRTGAAAFDPTLARATEEKLDCKVLIAAGATETFSFAQTGVDDPQEKRLTTVGRPFPGNELKITDENGKEIPPGQIGLLNVRGAATSSGYFGDLNATLEAWRETGIEGWYSTGDLARLDEDGYLVLVGRKKEIIIRGGQNIYPREIENFLLAHPKIAEAIVIGIPDQVMGERACACLTLAEGKDLAFDEIIFFLKEKGLAIHKLPERLEVFNRFPQLVDGQKVDKISLKKIILERIEAEKRSNG